MAGDNTQKSIISSNLLQMKFMRKSALRLEKEKNQDEIQHIIDDEHWVLDLPQIEQKQSKYVVESSYRLCENLRFGRMSFKGFNPEVEKLMQLQNNDLDLQEAGRKEDETSVNDKEMAERYQSLIGTISNKFKVKRQHIAVEEDNELKPNKKSKETVPKTS